MFMKLWQEISWTLPLQNILREEWSKKRTNIYKAQAIDSIFTYIISLQAVRQAGIEILIFSVLGKGLSEWLKKRNH